MKLRNFDPFETTAAPVDLSLHFRTSERGQKTLDSNHYNSHAGIAELWIRLNVEFGIIGFVSAQSSLYTHTTWISVTTELLFSFFLGKRLFTGSQSVLVFGSVGYSFELCGCICCLQRLWSQNTINGV